MSTASLDRSTTALSRPSFASVCLPSVVSLTTVSKHCSSRRWMGCADISPVRLSPALVKKVTSTLRTGPLCSVSASLAHSLAGGQSPSSDSVWPTTESRS